MVQLEIGRGSESERTRSQLDLNRDWRTGLLCSLLGQAQSSMEILF
jgi:hypothetical protein